MTFPEILIIALFLNLCGICKGMKEHLNGELILFRPRSPWFILTSWILGWFFWIGLLVAARFMYRVWFQL